MPRHQFEPLFKDLEGVNLVIPAIETLCPGWPVGLNPHLESIREDFQAWVNHWFKDEKIRRKIAMLDAPEFAAMNYPDSERQELLTMAKLIAWYFPWDDAIDDGSLYYKPEVVRKYRDDTIALIEQSLSWDPKPQEKPHPNPAIQSFWDLGVEIRSRGTPATNEQFRWAQCAFISSSVQGQLERELAVPVSIEQYLTRREKNIAVFPLMSLIHYNYQLDIPQKYSFKENKQMNKMWRLLARMGTISNDMLSLRRELLHGQFESLIPLLMYHDKLQPQEAMDRAGDMLRECYQTFNEVEAEMFKELPSELKPTMAQYLKGGKDLIMCNLHWSYGLRRYMEKDMLQPNGTVIFPIRLPPQPNSTAKVASIPATPINRESKPTKFAKESKRRTTSHLFTTVWPSIAQYFTAHNFTSVWSSIIRFFTTHNFTSVLSSIIQYFIVLIGLAVLSRIGITI